MTDATMTIEAIEVKRRSMNLPMTRLCAAAGVGRRTYDYLLNGRGAQPATLAKLQLALRRFQKGYGAEANSIAPHAAFRACLVLAAFHLSSDARAALNSDPSRRATANAEWMQAAQVRRLGLWIANQWFGFQQVDLARAADLTKQAVHRAIKELEWDRDPEGGNNRDLDRVMTAIEEIFT